MTHVDVEKKLKDILFERGLTLSYEEIKPSSPDDMYEVTFYLNDGKITTTYRRMFIRHDKSPKKKAFTMLLDEIIDSYYNSMNIGKRELPNI